MAAKQPKFTRSSRRDISAPVDVCDIDCAYLIAEGGDQVNVGKGYLEPSLFLMSAREGESLYVHANRGMRGSLEDKHMLEKTTSAPKPKDAQIEPSEKKVSKQSVVGAFVGDLFKRLLCSLLLKPKVWHWLMVDLPEAVGSAEEKFKAFIDALDSFFGG